MEEKLIVYPNCKINLGLNVVRKRSDGYHDLETVFYPVPLCDKLEAVVGEGAEGTCSLAISGNKIEGELSDNLIVKAYRMLSADHILPHINFNLEKHILPVESQFSHIAPICRAVRCRLCLLCYSYTSICNRNRRYIRANECRMCTSAWYVFVNCETHSSHIYRTSLCIRKTSANINKV